MKALSKMIAMDLGKAPKSKRGARSSCFVYTMILLSTMTSVKSELLQQDQLPSSRYHQSTMAPTTAARPSRGATSTMTTTPTSSPQFVALKKEKKSKSSDPVLTSEPTIAPVPTLLPTVSVTSEPPVMMPEQEPIFITQTPSLAPSSVAPTLAPSAAAPETAILPIIVSFTIRIANGTAHESGDASSEEAALPPSIASDLQHAMDVLAADVMVEQGYHGDQKLRRHQRFLDVENGLSTVLATGRSTACPEGSSESDVCLSLFASMTLLVSGEDTMDADAISTHYTRALTDAIEQGQLATKLQDRQPNSTVTILDATQAAQASETPSSSNAQFQRVMVASVTVAIVAVASIVVALLAFGVYRSRAARLASQTTPAKVDRPPSTISLDWDSGSIEVGNEDTLSVWSFDAGIETVAASATSRTGLGSLADSDTDSLDDQPSSV